MKRKKPKIIPATLSCKPTMELKPIPATVTSEPAPEPKFLPPVTLSYESTLELKPIPAAASTEIAAKPGEGAIRRITKAARTTRAKKPKAKRKGAPQSVDSDLVAPSRGAG
jgi:hypothetical protein